MDARVEHDLPARFRQNITWIDVWVVTSVQVAGGDEHGESERVLGVKLVFYCWTWATCLAAGRPLLSRVVRLRMLSIFGNHSESSPKFQVSPNSATPPLARAGAPSPIGRGRPPPWLTYPSTGAHQTLPTAMAPKSPQPSDRTRAPSERSAAAAYVYKGGGVRIRDCLCVCVRGW